MSNLQPIIDKILEDAGIARDALIEEANVKSNAIMAQAKIDAETKKTEIQEETARKCEMLESASKSRSLMNGRVTILSAKRKAIAEVLESVDAYFTSLEDDKYFELLNKIIAQNARPLIVEICFNANDFTRLPNNYLNIINTLVPEAGELIISKVPVDISGGCIIKYSDIYIDCTFSTLINQNKDALEDNTNTLLNSYWDEVLCV